MSDGVLTAIVALVGVFVWDWLRGLWSEKGEGGGGGLATDWANDHRVVRFVEIRKAIREKVGFREFVQERAVRWRYLWGQYGRDLQDDILALGWVESNWRDDVIGRAGEVGPLQVLPATRKALGERDTLEGYVIAGMRYWVMCRMKAGDDDARAYCYYNRGLGGCR